MLLSCSLASPAVNYIESITHKAHLSSELYLLRQPQASILPSNEVFSLSQDLWHRQIYQEFKLARGKNWLAIDLQSKKTEDYIVLLEGVDDLTEYLFFIQSDNLPPKIYKGQRSVENLIYTQVNLANNEKVKLYLYANSRGELNVALKVLTISEFRELSNHKNLLLGLSIGGLSALTLFLICVFIANHNKAMILLAAYFAFQTLNLLVMYGVNFFSLFPTIPQLHAIEVPIFTALSALALLWFSSELFKLTYLHQKLYWIYQAVSWLLLGYIVLSMFLSLNVNLIISNLVNVFTVVLLLILCSYLLKVNDKLARLFTLFVVTQAAFIVFNISKFGWFTFDAHLFSVAYWLNGLIIVYLLSRQSTLQIAEKHGAQREALESAMESRKANEELMILQAADHEKLEARVQERTFELNIALQELEIANRELEQKNTLDDLTGLFNRRYYDQKMLAEYRRSRRNLTPLSLIIIDIDHFKLVNDTHGHSAGDVCLVTLAKLMKSILRRSSDIGCRYGGEEFCIILPETNTVGAMAFAEELRALVEAHKFTIETGDIMLTVSCGVSTYLQQGDAKPVDIFNAADKALYQAKKNGRNQVKNHEVSTEKRPIKRNKDE